MDRSFGFSALVQPARSSSLVGRLTVTASEPKKECRWDLAYSPGKTMGSMFLYMKGEGTLTWV
jgi:hypothetical protein